uniref:Ribosome biogenesis protein NOP53 n=1 Tax=Meloidogyne javanica TaxID=6303 RepID=A0A915LZY6_MELJA
MEKQKGNSRLYDLWECEDNNLQNKRIKSTRYIPSILPPVTLPDEGISYNPPLGSYLDFLGKVVKEEEKIFAEEERVEKKIRPNDDEFFNFGGLKEDLKFTIEGPLSIGEVKTEVEEPVENEERVKSLQQRNILSIGGANKTTNIKNKLKIKFVEKRSVKSISEDSEII